MQDFGHHCLKYYAGWQSFWNNLIKYFHWYQSFQGQINKHDANCATVKEIQDPLLIINILYYLPEFYSLQAHQLYLVLTAWKIFSYI